MEIIKYYGRDANIMEVFYLFETIMEKGKNDSIPSVKA